MEKKKLTKKEILVALKAHVETMTEVDGIPVDVVLDYIKTTIEQIDTKAEKAKEKAAEKKVDGDKLREEVFACVTEEWQTADTITAALDKEDISKAKVVARLTQLFKAGLIEKEQQKVGDTRLMCYKIKEVEDAEDVESEEVVEAEEVAAEEMIEK